MFVSIAKTIMNLFYKNLEPHLEKKVAHHFFSTNSNPDLVLRACSYEPG
jgi:hypothetical protein